MYQLATVPASRQALRKLPRPVREHLVAAMQALAHNPYKGEQLQPPFRQFRSFHTTFANTQYRLVYEVDDVNRQIILRYAASRENFYRDLRHLNLKPLAQET
jgi:mRNA-degrading endonuclease RelE of RelBE toxin-antitoxin system